MVTRELIIGWQEMVDNWMMVFSWLANSCKQMVGIIANGWRVYGGLFADRWIMSSVWF